MNGFFPLTIRLTIHCATSMLLGLFGQVEPPIVRAALRQSCVYNSAVAPIGEGENPKDGDRKPSASMRVDGRGRLWIYRMELHSGSAPTPLATALYTTIVPIYLHRWQFDAERYYGVGNISHSFFWGGGTHDEYFRAAGVYPLPLEAIERFNKSAHASMSDSMRLAEFRESWDRPISLVPDHEALTRRFEVDGAGRYATRFEKYQIFFDFLCNGNGGCEAYVTEPHRGHRITRTDYDPKRPIQPDRGHYSFWYGKVEWKTDWKGPFYVAANGDERFIVTDTGRVFLAERNVKPGTPLKEIWKGPPVDALIYDTESKKWYGFTKNQYFEIADPIRPKPHQLTIRRSWSAEEAIATGTNCGRVIRNIAAIRINEHSWDFLASSQWREVNDGLCGMCNEPARAMALLREKLKPVFAPATRELAAVIDDLAARELAKRDAAQQRLREYGHTIEPLLRQALGAAVHPEQNRRLRQILADCEDPEIQTREERRAVRAVEVLKSIGTDESRRMLKEYAQGAGSAVLTLEARRALAARE